MIFPGTGPLIVLPQSCIVGRSTVDELTHDKRLRADWQSEIQRVSEFHLNSITDNFSSVDWSKNKAFLKGAAKNFVECVKAPLLLHHSFTLIIAFFFLIVSTTW